MWGWYFDLARSQDNLLTPRFPGRSRSGPGHQPQGIRLLGFSPPCPSIIQSEACIQVTWPVLANHRSGITLTQEQEGTCEAPGEELRGKTEVSTQVTEDCVMLRWWYITSILRATSDDPPTNKQKWIFQIVWICWCVSFFNTFQQVLKKF